MEIVKQSQLTKGNMEQKTKLLNIAIISGVLIGGVYYEKEKLEADKRVIMKMLDKTDYTGWDFSHFFLHFNIGLNAPKYWWVSILWSVSWEQLESYYGDNYDSYWKDSDSQDYKLNTSGLIVGLLTNYLMKKSS